MNNNPEYSLEGAEMSADQPMHQDGLCLQSAQVQPPRSAERQQGTRRGDYISQACLSCRKRKVKCSGEITCSECAKSGGVCEYSERRRKTRVDLAGRAISPIRSNDDVPVSVSEMHAHLSTLEAQCSRLSSALTSDVFINRRRLSPEKYSPLEIQPTEDQSNNDAPDATSSSSLMVPLTQLAPWRANSSPMGFGNPGPPIAAGQQQLREDVAASATAEGSLPAAPNPNITLPHSIEAGAQTMRHNNGAAYRRVFEVYFRCLQPLHPLINENQFQAQFNGLVFRGTDAIEPAEREPFLALAYLIWAEVSILSHPPTSVVQIPGWDEFCNADGLLRNMLWLGKENLLTLQCLILKTRCLIYVNQWHQAYDTVNTAVRICLAMKLNDQTKWNLPDVDSFENLMRERVFWCLFTINRVVGLNCEMPVLLKRSECNVRLPPSIDDRSLFPGHPVPEPTQDLSYIPYLHKLICWADICDRIWESVHSLPGSKLLSTDMLASLDNQILSALEEVPDLESCEFHSSSIFGKGTSGGPIMRPMLLYRVRMNCLRLMIRNYTMTVPLPDDNTAQEIVNIAGESVKILNSRCLDMVDETSHYVKATYFSSLLVSLSRVILGTTTNSACWVEASKWWKQALSGIKHIASLFTLGRRILFDFHALIKATEDMIAPHVMDLVAVEAAASDELSMGALCDQNMDPSRSGQACSAPADLGQEPQRLATFMGTLQDEESQNDLSLEQMRMMNPDGDHSDQPLSALQDIEWPGMVTW